MSRRVGFWDNAGGGVVKLDSVTMQYNPQTLKKFFDVFLALTLAFLARLIFALFIYLQFDDPEEILGKVKIQKPLSLDATIVADSTNH